MIARMWRGQTTSAKAEDYFRHATETVFPGLAALAGYRGAYLLRREIADRTAFLAVTLWESRAAIESFAGRDIDTAAIEAEARAVLVEFDGFALHYEIAFDRHP